MSEPTSDVFSAAGPRTRSTKASSAASGKLSRSSSERLREEVAEQLEREGVPYLSTARRDRAAFLVGAGEEREVLALARRVAQAEPLSRVAVGRPGRGSALGRSLVEARAALDAANGDVASFRDLGSLVSLGELSAVGNLMGRLIGGSLLIQGLIARWMYASLYKMHQASILGYIGVALDTVGRFLSRRTTPRVKLH